MKFNTISINILIFLQLSKNRELLGKKNGTIFLLPYRARLFMDYFLMKFVSINCT